MTASLQFSPVTTPASIQTTAHMARIIWQEYYPPIIGEAQVEYMLSQLQSIAAITDQITQQDCHYFLIHWDSTEPIGYLALQFRDIGLFISKLYLTATMRGKRLSRGIVNFAVRFASEHNRDRLILTVNRHNTHAITVYQHLGFEITGTQQQGIGGGFIMDDYVMQKLLQP